MNKLVRTFNLEEGCPTRHQAVLRLEHALLAARRDGFRFLKIIHGYGSSGVGGVLRFAVWSELRQAKERGEIHAWVGGEDFRISNEIAWEMVKKFPELKQDFDFGRGNKGISLVWL